MRKLVLIYFLALYNDALYIVLFEHNENGIMYRIHCENILDLVFTSEENMIKNMIEADNFGTSDSNRTM